MFGGLFYYGYQWWIGRTLAGDKDVTWIAGQGLGGQRLYIVPDLDLVVMVTQGLYLSGRQGHAGLDILYSFVIPAVRDNRPLNFHHRKATTMTLRFTAGDMTIHRIIEQEGPFIPALDMIAGLDAGTAGGKPQLDAAGRAR